MKEGIPSFVHQVEDGEALVTGQVRSEAGCPEKENALPSLSPELNPQTPHCGRRSLAAPSVLWPPLTGTAHMCTCTHAHTQEIRSTYTSVRMYKFIFKRRESGPLQRAAGRGDDAGALVKEGIRRLRKEKSEIPADYVHYIQRDF